MRLFFRRSQRTGGMLKGGAQIFTLDARIELTSEEKALLCKDVGELLAAEAAMTEAAQRLKGYLQAAVSFDGREELIEV